VAAGEKRDLQFGAHAVGRADQDRLAKTGELVAGAERADVGEHATRERPPGEFPDGRNGAAGFVDIHAGIAVADLFVSGQVPVYKCACATD